MKGDKTKLLRGDGEAIEVFTQVALILNVGDIVMSKGTFDNTTFDDDYEEVGGGKKKVEPIDLDVKYDKDEAIAALLRADFDSDDPVNYRIEWPDASATTFSFKALVTKLTMKTPRDENVTETFSFTPSGKGTWG